MDEEVLANHAHNLFFFWNFSKLKRAKKTVYLLYENFINQKTFDQRQIFTKNLGAGVKPTGFQNKKNILREKINLNTLFYFHQQNYFRKKKEREFPLVS